MATSLHRGRDGSSPRRLTPNYPQSRASSSRSGRSKSDDSEPSSPIAETSESLYTITSYVPPRLQARVPAKKPHDEWAKVFSKWQEMRLQLNDQLVEESRNANCKKLSRMAFLLRLSRDPEQDDQLRPLETFVGDEDGHIAIDIDKSSPGPGEDRNCQQPRGFVDHQIWLAGFAKPLTIPEQSYDILSPLQLEAALRPQQPIHVSAGHPNSFYRRLVYVGDPDSIAVTAMVKQATISQSWSLGDLFRGYFSTSPVFRLQVQVIPMPAKVANIIFHMPYLSLCKEKRVDIRSIGGRPLRKTFELSCLQMLDPEADLSQDPSKLYLNEGMMSVALTVRDDRWWGVTCLNDEFLLNKSRLEDETGDGEDSDEEGEEEDRVETTNIRLQALNAERNGLRLVDLDQGDPILDEGGGYTDRNPRVYSLIVLDTQLEILVQKEEVLYTTFSRVIKSYDESSLPRADRSGQQTEERPKAQVKDALDEAAKVLAKLLAIVKQQGDEVNRFMQKDLGLDLKTKATTFKDPLFVGLNRLSDPSAKDSIMRVMQSSGRLQVLRHGIEELIDRVTNLREAASRNMLEDLQISQHAYAAHGLKLGILHYVSQALTIPLNLYNIPHAVTNLPDNAAGLARVTLGLTSLFLVAPFLLALLFRFAQFLRGLIKRWGAQFWRLRMMKSRKD